MSSELVGAFTKRKYNVPSGRLDNNSSGKTMWAASAHLCARGIRASMHSKVAVVIENATKALDQDQRASLGKTPGRRTARPGGGFGEVGP